MSATGLDVFDRTLQETNLWLKDVMGAMGVPEERQDEHLRQRAYQALRSVLVTLRDRLPADLAAALGAQMPLLVRGIFYEGYRPAKQPDAFRNEGEFARRVQEYSQNHPIEPEEAMRAVFSVLENRLTDGLNEKVFQALPQDARAHWADRYVSA
jgi:uncharacterized protein (DUF2267 family)